MIHEINRQLNHHCNRNRGKLYYNGFMIFKSLDLRRFALEIPFRYNDRVVDLQVRHNFHFVGLS